MTEEEYQSDVPMYSTMQPKVAQELLKAVQGGDKPSAVRYEWALATVIKLHNRLNKSHWAYDILSKSATEEEPVPITGMELNEIKVKRTVQNSAANSFRSVSLESIS